jgi:hypothetical protein
LGGLGISSIKELSWALRMRWLWPQKTEPNQPWSSLTIQVPDKVQAFFSMVMQTEVGNGANTLFGRIDGFKDRGWLILRQDFFKLFRKEKSIQGQCKKL